MSWPRQRTSAPKREARGLLLCLEQRADTRVAPLCDSLTGFDSVSAGHRCVSQDRLMPHSLQRREICRRMPPGSAADRAAGSGHRTLLGMEILRPPVFSRFSHDRDVSVLTGIRYTALTGVSASLWLIIKWCISFIPLPEPHELRNSASFVDSFYFSCSLFRCWNCFCLSQCQVSGRSLVEFPRP